MKDLVKIEKGIPVPERWPSRFPFVDMDVGDSFVFPKNRRTSVHNGISYHRKAHDKKFTVRKLDDQTYRCWRIE